MLRQAVKAAGAAFRLQTALVRPVNAISMQMKRRCATQSHGQPEASTAAAEVPEVPEGRKVPEKHRDMFDPENPNLTKFEVVNDPELWRYVEKIIPPRRIPDCPAQEGSSGWIPPRLTREEARKLPYFVARTRNHMLPVYLDEEIRGPRYVTYVRKVQGDPWALRNELKAHLQQLYPDTPMVTRVNELTSKVGFKGKFVEEITKFLLDKGF